jgi:hypothetical protein
MLATDAGASRSWDMSGGEAMSVATMLSTPSGVCAMCKASWPADMDFGCGFHVSLSAGTRSRKRRVVGSSRSNSARRDWAMGTDSPFDGSEEWFGRCAL